MLQEFFDNWRLGDAKRIDGILIVVAGRIALSIEVGLELEEKVTDALWLEISSVAT